MNLRVRIIALTTGITTAVLILFAVPLAIALRQSASDRVVREAEYVVQGVADYFGTTTRTLSQSTAYVGRVNRRADTDVSVVLPDGSKIGATLPQGLPRVRDRGRSDGDGDGDSGQDEAEIGQVSPPHVERVGDGWVIDIASSNASGAAVVRGYVTDNSIEHQIHERWAIIGAGALMLIGLSAAAAEIVSRRLVRPLQATAETATALAGGDLDARAPVSGAREVSEVASSLNILADRIEILLASERETVADLSHRLRTPMTAIRLDVESMPDSEQMRDLTRHVAVLDQTLTGIIENARRPERQRGERRCDAREVASDRSSFWAPLAEDQGRTFDTDLGRQPAWVGCRAEDLAAALDALLENAIAHTPERTPLRVTLMSDQTATVIDVIDHGTGIPTGSGLRGRSDRGSTGLGLDIARTCAESTGGRLELLRVDERTVVRLYLQAPHSQP